MGSDCQLELREFGGHRDGPRLLVTAGIHGDEYLPMLAVHQLIGRFDADAQLRERLRGTLTLIPIVNRPAYRRGHRCGDDQKDLARSCPGCEDGSPTEQIAFALSRRIQAADYYVDLHTGGQELCVTPLAGYVLHPDTDILDQQRELAAAFQLPLLWGTSADLPGRSLSVARDCQVPAIYVEYLGGYRELTEIARREVDAPSHPLVSGCWNVMRHLGILNEPEQPSEPQQCIEDWRSGSGHMQVCNPAPATGFLIPQVQLGQKVAVGDLLAEIVSETSQQTCRVLSQEQGKVVVIRDYPRIIEGDAVAVIARSFEAA